jgi:hypothetical protein
MERPHPGTKELDRNQIGGVSDQDIGVNTLKIEICLIPAMLTCKDTMTSIPKSRISLMSSFTVRPGEIQDTSAMLQFNSAKVTPFSLYIYTASSRITQILHITFEAQKTPSGYITEHTGYRHTMVQHMQRLYLLGTLICLTMVEMR